MSLIVCGVPNLPPGEHGKPPILVEKDADCSDCGQKHDMEKCPECGSWIELGFGLMFGGLGEYKFCQKCNWHWKRVLSDDES